MISFQANAEIVLYVGLKPWRQCYDSHRIGKLSQVHLLMIHAAPYSMNQLPKRMAHPVWYVAVGGAVS
ncbi:MAG: hypothetical protein AMJ65_08745 [Phycisphaerae bacterium SG8_4]|nr:MAG: hypothetical protein AMJ65_08745 [Phycisphaerae bacterium SG8_4]